MRKIFVFLLFGAFVFGACKKEDQKEIDQGIIEKYITDHNLNALEGEDGLYYVLENEGSGARPTAFSTVTVHYRGQLTDGFVFDSSYDRGQPATFSLSEVIEGWQIGIPKFREGGKGKLLIPSHLAYGSRPPFGSGIPADAVLIFDVELLDVK